MFKDFIIFEIIIHLTKVVIVVFIQIWTQKTRLRGAKHIHCPFKDQPYKNKNEEENEKVDRSPAWQCKRIDKGKDKGLDKIKDKWGGKDKGASLQMIVTTKQDLK